MVLSIQAKDKLCHLLKFSVLLHSCSWLHLVLTILTLLIHALLKSHAQKKKNAAKKTVVKRKTKAAAKNQNKYYKFKNAILG